jgi:hypothetical protein
VTYKKLLSGLSLFCLSFAASTDTFTQMNQGGTGLLQTPTARMNETGDFFINYADNEEYRFWSVSLQLFPWMQATARYTDVRNRLYSQYESFSGTQTYKDKGLDVKFRLLEESFYLPETSIGFRDIGGTGLFNSEFINFSKRLYDFDFHLGIGWGHLGSSGNITNPFCKLDDDFCNRPTGFTGRGGKVDYQKFFKGEAAIFGGVEYRTPWAPLTLKLEYEGNDYSRDFARDVVQDKKWNIGANYHWQNVDFGLSYQRGNTIAFNVSYNFNFNTAKQHKLQASPRSLIQTSASNYESKTLKRALTSEAGFVTKELKAENNVLTLIGAQTSFRDDDESTERVARILSTSSNEQFEKYRIVEVSNNLPMVETEVDVEKFEAAAKQLSPNLDITESFTRQSPTEEIVLNRDKTKFSWGVKPFWIQSFGNPEAFYMYQGGALVSAGVNMPGNFAVHSTVKATLLENFDEFNFKVDSENSPLPRVRTYIREYVTRSKVTLENLYANWHGKLSENTYAIAYAGYLETMYGGIGGEFIYRPVDSNWAIGADINYVAQRDYSSEWNFFDYRVATGHVNLFWQPEFIEDSTLAFKVGRYLAKDTGVTIDFSKKFDSGIEVGAWAALTNVSAEEYGEGSFSKGFYLSIPFDLFSIKPSKGTGRIPWIPIGRDGGQALKRPLNIYDITSERSKY